MFKLYIINAGIVFRGIWQLIKPFIDKRTLKKITILGESYHDELFEIVD